MLSSVSEEIYKIVFSQCVHNSPDTQTNTTLLGLLTKYFKPIKSYFMDRHTFYQAKRRSKKSESQWTNK